MEKPAAPRRFLRFGLKSILALAFLCCLFFAWIGHNVYEMRQDQAAIEALNKAHRSISLQRDDRGGAVGWLKPEDALDQATFAGLPSRIFGFAERPRISSIYLEAPLGQEETTQAALIALERFPETASMQIHGPAVTDASCDSLSRISGLETVEFVYTRVGAKGLRRLASLPGLRTLLITQDDPSSDIVAAFPELRGLRDVTLRDQPLSREDLVGIASLPELESLAIRSPSAGAYDVLASASKLRKLWIDESVLDDDDVAAVAQLEELEYALLAFESAEGLARLAALPKLKSLSVEGPFEKDDFLALSIARPECVFGLEPPDPAPRAFFRGGEEVAWATVMGDMWK